MIAIWDWLTEPGDRVLAAHRRRARLVASILMMMILLGALSASVQLALVPGFLPTFVVIMSAVGVLVATWMLNRSGRCDAATLVTAALPSVASYAVVLANPADAGALAFALLGVIAASLLVSTRAGVVIALVTIAGVPLLAIARPEVPGSLFAAMGSFLAIGSILVIVTARHRDRVEDDRRREAERMMAHLQKTDRLAALGTLAASVAHEINNPLMFVSASLEMIAREGGADARRCSKLQDAQLGVDQITAVVRTLSGFARGDHDGHEAVDVVRSLEVAIRMAEPQIRGRARLARRFAEVPPITAGKHRLEQVFLNLLLNAAQAIPEGGGRISVDSVLGRGTTIRVALPEARPMQ